LKKEKVWTLDASQGAKTVQKQPPVHGLAK